ncbi:unnamed protein product [Periconia digitata]|uniref:Uncharacterized protein n=1 Tax=Periconia digitata TaxID=1303443 RepID=A0A9W4XRA4_9PLEO|nr:unnamed protein product [Periconia digitata]
MQTSNGTHTWREIGMSRYTHILSHSPLKRQQTSPLLQPSDPSALARRATPHSIRIKSIRYPVHRQ